MIPRTARQYSHLRLRTKAVLLRMAARGDVRDRTGTRSVLFRRGAAAYGDASQRLAGARTQERALAKCSKFSIDGKLYGAAPH